MNTPDQEAHDEENTAPDLGVLFIHGIGHQDAGDTLVQFGDPLLRWIDEWCRWGHLSEEVALDTTRYAALENRKLTVKQRAVLQGRFPRIEVRKAGIKCEDGTPAHAKIELIVPGEGKQCWLFAESCWANAFVTPTFAALAFWGVVIYPWMNASHYGAQIRRLWNRAHKSRMGMTRVLALMRAMLVTAVLFVGSVVVSVLAVAVLLLLLVLAIPPIPSLRAMLLRFQQKLAGSLGDSFILAASPIQKAAIVSQVRRDLTWLIAGNCRKIAIVAHSQGAAVAFETLATGIVKGWPSNASQLITFGSGLGKLREIENAMRSGKAGMGWIPIIGLTLIVASLECFNLINLVPFVEPSIFWGSEFGLLGLVFWLGGVIFGAQDQPAPEDFVPIEKFGAKVKWRDYYASHDPVSNGPLFDEDAAFLESEEVHNRASLWSDHTSYWLNCDEFVPRIVRDLGTFALLPILDSWPGDDDRVAEAARRRAWRVRWLSGARLAAWVTAGLIILMRLRDLKAWGAAALSKLPLVEKLVGWMGGEVFKEVKVAAHPVTQLLVGIALVMLLVAVGYHLIYGIWWIWTWHDTRVLLRRKDYGKELPYWIFVLAALVLTNAGFLVSLGWLLGEGAPPELGEGMNFLKNLLFPGVLAHLLVFFFRLMIWQELHFISRALEGAIAALIGAPLLAVILICLPDPSGKLLGIMPALFSVALPFAFSLLFILCCGNLIWPERQGWKDVPLRPGKAVSGRGWRLQ